MKRLNRSNFARSGSGDPDRNRGFGNPLRAISDPLGLRGWIGCHWAALGLISLIVLGAALRLAPISANRFHQDEALYSFWALQIASGRDPILIHSRVDKPPLFIYALALCFRLLGPSEVAARLPSELASVASIALVYYLAWRLYGRAVALAAAILMTFSPFNILFAPTAFTDPLLVAWVLAALCLAVQGRFGWSGLALGLASATKQQGLLFVPLVVVLGIGRLVAEKPVFFALQSLPGHRKYPPWRGFRVQRIPKTWLLAGLFSALGFLAVMAPVAWWDSLRWRLQPNYFEQSLISHGGLAWADRARLIERLRDWAEILHYMTASPFLNLLLLVGLPGLLLHDLGWQGPLKLIGAFRQAPSPDVTVRAESAKPYGLKSSPRRGLCPFSTGVQPRAFFDVTLSAFAILFLLGHWLLNFNIWDRYLLGLVPLLLILLARVIWLASGALPKLPPSLEGRGRGRVGSRKLRFLGGVILLTATLAGPASVAAQSGYPIGGDHGAYDGIKVVAAYFREQVPAGSILYHHWLGWHYSFYMFDFPLTSRWYPTPEKLAEDAHQVDDAQRYIVFPSGKSTAGASRALSNAGLTLHRVHWASRRDGSTSFTVYRIEEQK